MTPEPQPECIGIIGLWFGHAFVHPVYDPRDGASIGMVCKRCGLYAGSPKALWKTAQRDGGDHG